MGYFDSNPGSDCVICVIGPLVQALFFTIPLKIDCQHHNPKITNPVFEINRCYLFSAYFFGILVSLCLLSFPYLTYLHWEDKIACISLLIDLVFSTKGAFLYFISLIRIEFKIADYQNFIYLVQKCRSFGITTVINKRNAEILRRKSRFLAFAIFAVMPVLIYFNVVGDDFELKFFRNFPVILSLLLQFALVFQVSQYNSLLELSYRAVNKQIKIVLKRRMSGNGFGFCGNLKKLTSFLSHVNLNVQLINTFLNPSILIWVVKMVAILILNTYLGIILFDQILEIGMVMLHLRSFLTITAIIYLIHSLEVVGQQVRKIYIILLITIIMIIKFSLLKTEIKHVLAFISISFQYFQFFSS